MSFFRHIALMDWISFVSQTKSAIQAVRGDLPGARETQQNFSRQCPIVSQCRWLTERGLGREEEARDTLAAFLETLPRVAVAAAMATAGAVALPLAGFTGAGVTAGSWAAAWQSALGDVAAGSVFSFLQSAGATSVGTWIGALVGSGAGAVAGAVIPPVVTKESERSHAGTNDPPRADAFSRLKGYLPLRSRL